jgi:AraC family transcriptional regulator, alkane utilization regulator
MKEPGMDVLSDVLTTVRLHSAIHFCPELSAPWGIQVSAQRDRAIFYVLSRGSCYLEVDGLAAPVPLVGGDVAMLPHGAAHIVRDQVHTPAIPLEALLQEGCASPAPRAFQHGGGGGKSAFVVGYFQFGQRAASQFLAPLPPLIHIRAEAGQSVPWLEATLKFLAAESTSEVPGAQLIMARLTDVLCVQILRAYIAQEATEGQTCDQQAGMLRALRGSPPRQGAGVDASTARASLDGGGTGRTGAPVADRLCGALPHAGRRRAARVFAAVADAEGQRLLAAGGRASRGDCRAHRLRV